MRRWEKKQMRRFYANRRPIMNLISEIDKAANISGQIEHDSLIKLGERARQLVIEFGSICTYTDYKGKSHLIIPTMPDSPKPISTLPGSANEYGTGYQKEQDAEDRI